MNLGGEALTSEFAKLIDDEMLKEDCKNLREFNNMKDSKLFTVFEWSIAGVHRQWKNVIMKKHWLYISIMAKY